MQPDHRDLSHAWALRNSFLDFLAGDVFAAGLNHVFLAIEKVKPSVLVHVGHVAGMVPATAKQRFIRRGIFKVAWRNTRAAQHDLTGLARLNVFHLFINNAQFQRQVAHADRIRRSQHSAKLSRGRGGPKRRGLRLPPAVDPFRTGRQPSPALENRRG